MAQLAIRGYEVEVLGYLVKPVPYAAFSPKLGSWYVVAVELDFAVRDTSDLNSLHGGFNGVDAKGLDRDADPERRHRRPAAQLPESRRRGGVAGQPRRPIRRYADPRPEVRDALTATTDAPTVVNMTSTYWNRQGEVMSSILDHELTLAASAYAPVDSGLIPTGKMAEMFGQVYDTTGCSTGPKTAVCSAPPGCATPDFGRALPTYTNGLGIQYYTGSRP
jgi:hypothetical protein